jgi:phage tail-like protein
MARTNPFGAFNFEVNFGGPNDPGSPLGGFSDVSGLVTETTIAEYRNGNDAENHVRKIAGLFTTGDVTCKRGLIDPTDLWEWIEEVRREGSEKARDIVITMFDEARKPVCKWTLRKAIPKKLSGPTFAAKASGDVAMEEFVMAAEKIEFEKA